MTNLSPHDFFRVTEECDFLENRYIEYHLGVTALTAYIDFITPHLFINIPPEEQASHVFNPNISEKRLLKAHSDSGLAFFKEVRARFGEIEGFVYSGAGTGFLWLGHFTLDRRWQHLPHNEFHGISKNLKASGDGSKLEVVKDVYINQPNLTLEFPRELLVTDRDYEIIGQAVKKLDLVNQQIKADFKFS